MRAGRTPAPVVAALLLFLYLASAGSEGASPADGRSEAATPNAESIGNQLFDISNLPLREPTILGDSEDQDPPADDTPQSQRFGHLHPELLTEDTFSIKDSNNELNKLFAEFCENMDCGLHALCRKLTELYSQDGVPFLQPILSEKRYCSNTVAASLGNIIFLPMEPKFLSPINAAERLLAHVESNVLRKWHSPQEMRIHNSCDVCHATTDQICKDLINHDQQIEIMKWLFDGCEVFQRHVNQCKRFIFEYGPLFLANLHKFLISEDVCQLIHMCAEP